eukprot:CAMPEP_0185783900 /NCGR_PEP_ID=MMETSP1174-20130828/119688_1 /TAXON_ID=35687 /ORGANISM="Dictyocha speculum, Strain CCMP1381" /LENGTH=124 /DNA_ID=CAMNT_0028475189 /DNA_START=104 /DNA_END=478 /DNA_ORIENTATION=-
MRHVTSGREGDVQMPSHLEDMWEEIREGEAILVDVREPNEWSQAYFKDASLVSLSSLMDGQLPDLPQGDKRLYLHCAAGIRVHRAHPILNDMGYTDIVSLNEGFNELAMYGGSEIVSGERPAPW